MRVASTAPGGEDVFRTCRPWTRGATGFFPEALNMVAILNGGAVFRMADLCQSVGRPRREPDYVGAGTMDTGVDCRGHADDPFDDGDDNDEDDDFPDDDEVDGDDCDDDDEPDDDDDLVGAASRVGADN